MLLTVGGKVLNAHADIAALHALDQAGGKLGGQIGVFAEILKIAAAQGAALDVYCRAQVNGHLLVLAGVAHAFADLAQQIPVKAGSCGASRRIADRLDAVVDPR